MLWGVPSLEFPDRGFQDGTPKPELEQRATGRYRTLSHDKTFRNLKTIPSTFHSIITFDAIEDIFSEGKE